MLYKISLTKQIQMYSLQYFQEFKLLQDSFLFYIVLTAVYGVPITQKKSGQIYEASVEQCYRVTEAENNITNTCKSFILKNCASLQLNSNIQQQLNISQAILDSAVCFDPEDWNTLNLSLQGTPQTPNFRNLQFNIKKCDNSTSNGNCASQDIINQKLKFALVGFFVSDYVLNQQKQGNPFSMVSKLISTTVSVSSYKSMTLWMRKQILYNNENFFYYFEDNTSFQALFFNQQSEQVFNTQNDSLISIVMYLDDREALYYRTYNNILDILGNMGGLLELMLTIIGLIVRPLNKLSCDLLLAQEIFHFDSTNNKTQIHPQDEKLIFSFDEKPSEGQLMKLRKYFKLKASKLQLFIHSFLFANGSDKAQIQKSIEAIYMKIDILFMINKMIEIDKLKKLLLTDDQQVLFNYIHRPKIMLGNTIDMKSSARFNCYDQTELTFEQEICKAYDSYCYMRENDDISHRKLNNKLLELLDKDIKRIFDLNCQAKQNQQNLIPVHQISSINDLSLVDMRQRQQSNLIRELESVINI